VAGRDNGFTAKANRKLAQTAAEGYRTAMRGFAEQPFLDVWYAHMDVEPAIREVTSQIKAKRVKMFEKLMAKAHTKDSTSALDKLTAEVDGQRRIISNPPTIVPVEEIFANVQAAAIYEQIAAVVNKYRRSLQSDRRHLLNEFQAGARGAQGRRGGQRRHPRLDRADGRRRRRRTAGPAGQGGPDLGPCGIRRAQPVQQRGRARGCRAASDGRPRAISSSAGPTSPGRTGVDRDFYVRQLRDWKFSVPIELMRPEGMMLYARLCGWTLARAHARSGDRIALPPTSAVRPSSTTPSLTSRRPTPTRTISTTRSSRPPSGTAGPKPPARI